MDMNAVVGTHDVLLLTLDTLRYDVAEELAARGLTPHLAALLPGGRWEERHSPASFTYAAHHAFFAGFLPTPASPGLHPVRPGSAGLLLHLAAGRVSKNSCEAPSRGHTSHPAARIL